MPAGQERHREESARQRRAERRGQEVIGVLDFGDIVHFAPVEGRRAQDQDGRVDEHGEP